MDYNETQNEDEIQDHFLDIFHKNDYKPKNPCKTTFKEYRDENMRQISTGKIYKKILSKGSEGCEVIGENVDSLRIQYSCEMFIESVVEPCVLYPKGILCLSKGIEEIVGIVEALKTMKLNEESLFWISSDLMYGQLGLPTRKSSIPPNSDVIVKLRVNSIKTEDKEEPIETTPFEKIRKSVLKREKIAAKLFNMKDFDGAAHVYREMIRELEKVKLKSENEQDLRNSLLIKFLTRSAISSHKNKEYSKVCIMIRRLEFYESISRNVTALFLKGYAKLAFDEFEDAEYYLRKAQQLDPKSEDIQLALNELVCKRDQLSVENLIKQLDLDLLETSRIVDSMERENLIRKNCKEETEQVDQLKNEVLRQLEYFKKNPNSERYDFTGIKILNHKHFKIIDKLCAQNGFWLYEFAKENSNDYFVKKIKNYAEPFEHKDENDW